MGRFILGVFIGLIGAIIVTFNLNLVLVFAERNGGDLSAIGTGICAFLSFAGVFISDLGWKMALDPKGKK